MENATPPQPPKPPAWSGVKSGVQVVFTDVNGKRHPAMVGRAHADGTVNLVSFGVDFGDEATGMEFSVRYDPKGGPQTWSWAKDLRGPEERLPLPNEMTVQQ